MSGSRRRLLGDVSWLQLLAGALAAMIAAWAAGQLGVTGTIIGAALGSLVATVSTAFFHRTLEGGRTLLIQTERGTLIERHLDDGESVTEAFDEVADVASQPRGARVVDDRPRLHWRTIMVTSLVVLALAMAAISTYELVVGRTWGGNDPGSTIGDTFGGGSQGDEPSPSPSTATPVPTPTVATPTVIPPTPTPTETLPTPFPTDPATASPTPR